MTQAATLKKNEEGFAPLKNETASLPPMLLLEVDGTMRGVLQEVSEVVDEEEEVRIYYRFCLTAKAAGTTRKVGLDGKKAYVAVEFPDTAVISLPGTGGLDYTMARIARKSAGGDLKAEHTPWAALTGDLFVITRTEDGEMSKGKHKGKPVKNFTVQHGRAISKK